jgi:hypothetical protein
MSDHVAKGRTAALGARRPSGRATGPSPRSRLARYARSALGDFWFLESRQEYERDRVAQRIDCYRLDGPIYEISGLIPTRSALVCQSLAIMAGS